MARGWESKSVETQIENGSLPKSERAQRSELDNKREGLLLTRVRVTRELESSRNPRHREILEQALAHLDRELALMK